MNYLDLFHQLHQMENLMVDVISYERALSICDAQDTTFYKSNQASKLLQIAQVSADFYSQVFSILSQISETVRCPPKDISELLKHPMQV